MQIFRWSLAWLLAVALVLGAAAAGARAAPVCTGAAATEVGAEAAPGCVPCGEAGDAGMPADDCPLGACAVVCATASFTLVSGPAHRSPNFVAIASLAPGEIVPPARVVRPEPPRPR